MMGTLLFDADLLTIAAQASPPLANTKDDPGKLAKWIKDLPASDKDSSSTGSSWAMGARSRWNCGADSAVNPAPLVTAGPGAPWPNCWTPPPKLGTSASAWPKPHVPCRRLAGKRERALAREKRLDVLDRDPETAWARVESLIDTRKPGDYDAAVDLLKDLQTIAHRAGHAAEFAQRFGLLRRQHHRKPSLIVRFDQVPQGDRGPVEDP